MQHEFIYLVNKNPTIKIKIYFRYLLQVFLKQIQTIVPLLAIIKFIPQ